MPATKGTHSTRREKKKKGERPLRHSEKIGCALLSGATREKGREKKRGGLLQIFLLKFIAEEDGRRGSSNRRTFRQKTPLMKKKKKKKKSHALDVFFTASVEKVPPTLSLPFVERDVQSG